MDGVSLDDALPEYMQLDISDILTEGQAATRHPTTGDWVGSLANSGFYTLKGYWLNNSTMDNIEFSWVIPDDVTFNKENKVLVDRYNQIPIEFKYAQSSKQAFYFFENMPVNHYFDRFINRFAASKSSHGS